MLAGADLVCEACMPSIRLADGQSSLLTLASLRSAGACLHTSRLRLALRQDVRGQAEQRQVGPVPLEAAQAAARARRSRMTLEEKVAQVAQLEVADILDIKAAEETGVFSFEPAKLERYACAGVGSFFNSPVAPGPHGRLKSPTTAQWRSAMMQLAAAYRKAGQVAPIFGLDSVHGANFVADAPIFPHQLHCAASFDAHHAYAAARSAGAATRAAGVQWVFAPVLDVASSARFPRVYETFGEDPVLVAALGAASVQGLQGTSLDVQHLQGHNRSPNGHQAAGSTHDIDLTRDDVVAACIKHFAGYQASRSGYDRAPAWLPPALLRNVFLPPFQAGLVAGAASLMLAYNAPEDTPMILSRRWTQDWLRGEAGFDGLVVTDFSEVYNQVDWHRSASSNVEAVAQALLRSSMDMAMVPFKDHWLTDAADVVLRGYVAEARLDEAVDRVLTLKARVGLLPLCESHVAPEVSTEVALAVPARVPGDSESAEAAADGVVLLKNERGTLPLHRARRKGAVVAVVGPSADCAANLLGGWSYHWQGPATDTEMHFPTIAVAMRALLEGVGARVLAATGVKVSGQAANDDALAVAEKATDAIIFAYGEGPYAEIFGDISSSYLPPAQVRLAADLAAVAKRRGVPLIGIFIGGRDRLLSSVDALLDAHLAAFFPGPHGGSALAAIVMGDKVPCGRLPITLHAGDTQTLPYWRGASDYTVAPKSMHDQSVNPRKQQPPLYQFGHGLTYTTFEFADLQAKVISPSGVAPPSDTGHGAGQAARFGQGDEIVVSLSVTNTGTVAAAWPVLLFVGDDYCVMPPPPPMLKGFTKVHLEPGSHTTVTFTVTLDMLAFEASDDIVRGGGRYVQPGTFTVCVEGLTASLLLPGDPLRKDDWVTLRSPARPS